ncbi:rhodanese-like domain-containing protein [Chryseotalea sanaruensis]|uniref:Rhodanese-like domain-containing protein n=1 Tax=Chryseotalea sanaruensis TaxID=2482724 RepID=A0A401U9I6_9BACT|nr:rhodanese-like domain-containing protein [Chryseotalea sanaruensis]GCC51540.1 rhodanese-like domain-containing protein [Chryseotalea sanaruensis]
MFQNVDNKQFKELFKKANTLVLDVRTPKEVAEGHIPQANLFLDINGAFFESELVKLDKSKNYLVYCRSGARSARACKIMEDKGFKGELYNLAMGITGWDGDVKK